ncbi:hypothetical protein [Apilactobacillus xinyiensis]|uniref:hypothetical protein n=1 Tax=Apilactobacillus xinyiensis TaxID=2841032 RepID=UPI00200D1756|nr:hypothetical protein [Apilactobacillus xinyiensis]MCL0330859.1 hypothetical protein [Apilactobacillus xinyiensis]
MILLRIYKKGADTKNEAPLFEGTELAGNTATITGLPAGTIVQTGDYIALNHDSEGKLADSDAVDLPGFTVVEQKAEAPNNLKVDATDDGATVTEGE